MGQAGTVRQVYRSGCHKSIRFLCAVRFFLQFRVDAGDQLVRRRCAGLCWEHRRDAEPSAADQHLALFCDAVFLFVCHRIPENGCDFTVLCSPKLCLLRYVSAENTGVPINLSILFHMPPFCLPLEAAFIDAVPLSNLRDRPRRDRGRFSFAGRQISRNMAVSSIVASSRIANR